MLTSDTICWCSLASSHLVRVRVRVRIRFRLSVRARVRIGVKARVLGFG